MLNLLDPCKQAVRPKSTKIQEEIVKFTAVNRRRKKEGRSTIGKENPQIGQWMEAYLIRKRPLGANLLGKKSPAWFKRHSMASPARWRLAEAVFAGPNAGRSPAVPHHGGRIGILA
jgi:hypothetical protein